MESHSCTKPRGEGGGIPGRKPIEQTACLIYRPTQNPPNDTRPSREDEVPIFSLWGHTVYFSGFELLLVGAILLGVAGFLLGLSRGRRVVLQRSAPTDELAVQLKRIANTLERIANHSDHAADVVIAAAASEVEPVAEPKPSEPVHAIPYSMFGR
jgi:hypothetical protein